MGGIKANKKRTRTRIDMHCHTRGSDGHGTPEEFVRAAKKARLHGVVITDHNLTTTVEGQKIVRALKKAGILSFAACEYATKQGHLLIYGPDIEDIGLGPDVRYPEMQDVIDAVNRAGGVAIPAHPYKGYRYHLGDDVFGLEGLVALEAANGQNQAMGDELDSEARSAADEMGLRTVGGSDAHWATDVGICFTEFEGHIATKAQLLRALKNGVYRAKVSEARVEARRAGRVKFFADQKEAWEAQFRGMDSWARKVDFGGRDHSNASDCEAISISDEEIPWWAYSDGLKIRQIRSRN